MKRILECAGWSQLLRSPREPTSLFSSLPFLLSQEDQRRLRERNETRADRARVEGERGGNQNKLEKSGGFTPLVVIPRVREDPSSLTACLSPSPSLRAEPTA